MNDRRVSAHDIEVTDSTIDPPVKPAIFLNERFMATRHVTRNDAMKNKRSCMYFIVCKGV